MPPASKPRIITLEEHFTDPALLPHFSGIDAVSPALIKRLEDVADQRLKEMDEAGIDLQVLSQSAPATQKLPADLSIALSRHANDYLAEITRNHPTRFAGFACLPTQDPAAAVEELERCVTKLGFKGAMVHGLTNGAFLDEKRFWPIFERAQALDVPIYLHPAIPHQQVIDVYYEPYVKDFPTLLRAGWGFTVETATHAIRLILSGLFDAYPQLKIILGHLGEGLPFLLLRIDEALSRTGNRPLAFRETFCRNFHLTTSGNFSDTALLCTMMEMGVDRIMFSVDWPFVNNKAGVDWLMRMSISSEDKTKIFSANAERLLRL
jgi:2,3-dihydroxybenzoate decarboxylase